MAMSVILLGAMDSPFLASILFLLHHRIRYVGMYYGLNRQVGFLYSNYPGDNGFAIFGNHFLLDRTRFSLVIMISTLCHSISLQQTLVSVLNHMPKASPVVTVTPPDVHVTSPVIPDTSPVPSTVPR